jgi:putative transposase
MSHVSNDNPFSESQFKTLKYRPEFPDRFGSIEDARVFCQKLFDWYNNEHYHAGIALMTPATVHYGRAKDCSRRRQKALDQASIAHPERFVSGSPTVLKLPTKVWINPPAGKKIDTVSSVTIMADSGVTSRNIDSVSDPYF